MHPLNGNFHNDIETILGGAQPSIFTEKRSVVSEIDPISRKPSMREIIWQREIVAAKRPLARSAHQSARLDREHTKGQRNFDYTIELGEKDSQGNPMPQRQLRAIQYSDGTVVGKMLEAHLRLLEVLNEGGGGREELPETRGVMDDIQAQTENWGDRFRLKGPMHWETIKERVAVLPRGETAAGIVVGDLIGIKELARGRMRLFWGTFARGGSMTTRIEASQEFGANNPIEPVTLEKWAQLKRGIEERRAGRYEP